MKARHGCGARIVKPLDNNNLAPAAPAAVVSAVFRIASIVLRTLLGNKISSTHGPCRRAMLSLRAVRLSVHCNPPVHGSTFAAACHVFSA